MNKHSLIYVTTSDKEEAERIASRLLEKNLIACANIFPAHQAVYRWDGEIKSESETAMILKTRLIHFKEIEKVIRDMHSYDCPCMISLGVQEGHIPFLEWIDSQT